MRKQKKVGMCLKKKYPFTTEDILIVDYEENIIISKKSKIIISLISLNSQ